MFHSIGCCPKGATIQAAVQQKYRWHQAAVCEGLAQGPYKVATYPRLEPMLSALRVECPNH